MTGRTIGHYRILQKLGAGGMGEVYAAEDERLHRVVALKILPPEMAADRERLQRFRREAQAVAALNHPNIVTLYGLEEAEGLNFLTMELVSGETLGKAIRAGGLPLPQFLNIAVPLADAVSEAHARGIVHRDLKPANVMVTTEGRVKVLDFGLAKLRRDESAAEAATATLDALTAQHGLMGTAPYMSPEQAEGLPTDARSDIFSLGVIFYEMATGSRPFRGNTAISVISSILKDVPLAPVELNPAVPPDLDRIIRRCLAKEPPRRYQSAGDLRNDLEDLEQQCTATDRSTPRRRAGARKGLWAALATGALLLVAGATILWRARLIWSRGPAFAGAAFSQVTSQPGVEWFPSLSPDGKWLVYGGSGGRTRHIYLQSASGQNPLDLTPDSGEDNDQPAFSPDGERIAFRSSREGGGIFVMGRTGEAVRRLTRTGFRPAWSPDGAQIAFTTENVDLNPQNSEGRSELWTVNVNSSEARRLFEGDAILASWSPHNQRIAFTRRLAYPAQNGIWTIPATGGVPTPVTTDRVRDWSPAWSPDGKYLYLASDRGGSMNLWRVPIDEASGQTRGAPEPVTTPAPFLAHPNLSSDGRRIAYSSVLVTANIQQLRLDSSGAPQGEPAWVTTGSRRWSSPDPSPDGEWVAFYSLTQPEGHLYLSRPDGTGLRQLTGDAAIDRMPRWSPDGKWIAFFSNRSGRLEVWKIRPDGSDLQQLTDNGGTYLAWSPDGSRMAASSAVLPGDRKGVRMFDPNLPEIGRASCRERV